jgi:hypothetical protein
MAWWNGFQHSQKVINRPALAIHKQILQTGMKNPARSTPLLMAVYQFYVKIICFKYGTCLPAGQAGNSPIFSFRWV